LLLPLLFFPPPPTTQLHTLSLPTLFRSASGRPVHTLPVKGREVTASPDGRRLVVCEEECYSAWDAGTWERLFTVPRGAAAMPVRDRKSTRLNSSHVAISYAVFCLKKKIT